MPLSQNLRRCQSKPPNTSNQIMSPNRQNNNNQNFDYGSNNNKLFKFDLHGSTSSNLFTNSSRHMNNFVSSNSIQLNSQSYNADTNSLYHYMREQRKNTKAQIFESLDYEINENVLYLMEKKDNLRSKQKGSKFFKYLKSFFPSQKEFSRWFIIFLIGTFTALTACFIVVNVEFFSDHKYDKIRELFNNYVSSSNNILVDTQFFTFNTSLYEINSNQSSPYQTLSFDKLPLSDKLIKMQIPLMFWFLTNAIPVFIGSILITYLAPVAAASGIPVIKCKKTIEQLIKTRL